MMLRSVSWSLIGFSLLLTAASARAEVQTKNVTYQHQDLELVGYLAWDDQFEGRRPGVLVVHEWWGLNGYARLRAEKLAQLGYVAFALDMYGQKVTEHPQEAREWSSAVRENVESWRQRAQAGLEVLRRQENVDPEQIAAIGYCFGGSTVQQLAYSGAPVKGVVSFHGGLTTPEADRTEPIKARILACHGAADPFIPEQAAQEFREALSEAGADWQMIYYADARHSFTNPDADERNIDGIQYNRKADVRSWHHMRLFFAELFD